MSVYKPSKSRFYQYDFQYKGRRFHGSTGVETRRRAEEVERSIRTRVALGQGFGDDSLTLDQAAGRWWVEVGQHLATAETVSRRLATTIRLIGKDMPITEISTKVVSRAIEKRRGETFTKAPDRPGKPAKRYRVSNATVNADIIGVLRRVLRRARTTWEVKGLPEIDWKELALSEPAPKIQFYTQAQQAAWLAECDPTAAEALRMLLTYGLRLGELFFPPTAFDSEGPRIVYQGDERKGDVPRVLPLRLDDGRRVAARVSRAISGGMPSIWFEQAAPTEALDKVLRRTSSEPRLVPVTYYGMQARLRSAAKRAGITTGRVIHGARHHAGTEILRRTGNLKLTQELLAHKDIKSTMRYAHALEDTLRAALEAESRHSPEPSDDAAEQTVIPQRVRGRRPRLS